MSIIDILFTSEWVSTLFIVICAAIAAKFFVLPKEFENAQSMRLTLLKKQAESKGVRVNVYNI